MRTPRATYPSGPRPRSYTRAPREWRLPPPTPSTQGQGPSSGLRQLQDLCFMPQNNEQSCNTCKFNGPISDLEFEFEFEFEFLTQSLYISSIFPLVSHSPDDGLWRKRVENKFFRIQSSLSFLKSFGYVVNTVDLHPCLFKMIP